MPHRNIHTQETQIPSRIGPTAGVTWENSSQVLRDIGWRIEPPIPPVPDGFVRVSIRLVEGDGELGAWEVRDRPTSEIEAEQYAADLTANGARYVLENQYLILCDVLRQALGQTATQRKLGFEELPGMMLAVKAANHAAYEKLRDAMDMINSALIRYDVRWWDAAAWHPQPELTEQSNAILGMV